MAILEKFWDQNNGVDQILKISQSWNTWNTWNTRCFNKFITHYYFKHCALVQLFICVLIHLTHGNVIFHIFETLSFQEVKDTIGDYNEGSELECFNFSFKSQIVFLFFKLIQIVFVLKMCICKFGKRTSQAPWSNLQNPRNRALAQLSLHSIFSNLNVKMFLFMVNEHLKHSVSMH